MGDFVLMVLLVVVGVVLLGVLLLAVLRPPLRRFNRARARLGADVRAQVATLHTLAGIRRQR